MKDEPEIVKILREEEKLGKLYGKAQSAHEELEIPKELLEDVPNKIIRVGEDDVKKREFDVELAQYADLLSREIFDATSDLLLYLDAKGNILDIIFKLLQ